MWAQPRGCGCRCGCWCPQHTDTRARAPAPLPHTQTRTHTGRRALLRVASATRRCPHARPLAVQITTTTTSGADSSRPTATRWCVARASPAEPRTRTVARAHPLIDHRPVIADRVTEDARRGIVKALLLHLERVLPHEVHVRGLGSGGGALHAVVQQLHNVRERVPENACAMRRCCDADVGPGGAGGPPRAPAPRQLRDAAGSRGDDAAALPRGPEAQRPPVPGRTGRGARNAGDSARGGSQWSAVTGRASPPVQPAPPPTTGCRVLQALGDLGVVGGG